MLKILFPDAEYFNDLTNEFFIVKGQELVLEHSLVSVSKWEAKYLKPFLSSEKKTTQETLDYIKFMTVSQNVDDRVYGATTASIIDKISNYIEHPMTATIISKTQERGSSSEYITSELIYYWMIAHSIPFECQKWHLNRLLTLIKVCNVKNQPKKKVPKKEIASRNAELNAARKAKLGTRG